MIVRDVDVEKRMREEWPDECVISGGSERSNEGRRERKETTMPMRRCRRSMFLKKPRHQANGEVALGINGGHER